MREMIMKIIKEGTFQTGYAEEKFLYEENTDRNKNATYDPNMVCYEAYNNSGFEIEFQSQRSEDIGTKYFKFRIKNDDFAFVPHNYYTVFGLEKSGNRYLPNGTPLNILRNYGDAKFKGNKTPSSPDTILN
jgi:hypothetical protein